MPRNVRTAIASLALCALISGAGTLLSDGKSFLDGWLFDLSLPARAALFPPSSAREESPVAVVAVDARSLGEPELATTPRVLFAPVWARLIEALAAADARTIAFDFLLPYSASNFRAGYDRPFVRALARNRNRIVLGRSATTLPARPFLAALAFDENALGLLELAPESDGVYRRIPAGLQTVGGEWMPSLFAATLLRAGAGEGPHEVLLAPRKHLETIPSYALIDVLRCAQDAPERIRQAFAGRIVFIGTVLPEEDRKLNPGRFLRAERAPAAPSSAACDLPPMGASAPRSRTVPGVYLHAAAAEAAMTGEITTPMPLPWSVGIAAVAGGAGAAAGILLMPWLAFAIVIAACVATWAMEVLLLQGHVWFPASPAIVSLMLSCVLVYSVRYLVEVRRRRRVQGAFGRYLSPVVVAQLMESWNQLKLGGDERDVTVMFADLSGFTALSTQLSATALIELTNRYLALIVAEVDATGGYVDKFIGDAVMSIWGAPVDDPEHAHNAVRAGLAIAERIGQERAESERRGEHGFGVKIGLHSGLAVVGNVGSEQRYNYTGVGETVNIASRLESVPAVYGCAVVIGPTTAEAISGRVLLRELDRVSVKGRDEPLTVYQPIAPNGDETPEQAQTVDRYHAALALYRDRQFEEACRLWDRLSARDGPSSVMANRARNYVETPPPADWDDTWVLSSK